MKKEKIMDLVFSLTDLADRYVEADMHPNEIHAIHLVIIEAIKRGIAPWLAVYFHHGIDLGFEEGDCRLEVQGIETLDDVYDNMKAELDEYCELGWKSKLEQLIELGNNAKKEELQR